MPFVGHLNPMTALGRKLQSRGHEIAVIGVPDVEPFARAADLAFVPFCEEEYPAGSIAKLPDYASGAAFAARNSSCASDRSKHQTGDSWDTAEECNRCWHSSSDSIAEACIAVHHACGSKHSA